jgi:hypothetical protein
MRKLCVRDASRLSHLELGRLRLDVTGLVGEIRSVKCQSKGVIMLDCLDEEASRSLEGTTSV